MSRKNRNGNRVTQPLPKPVAQKSADGGAKTGIEKKASVALIPPTPDPETITTFSNIDRSEMPLFGLNLWQDKLGWSVLRFTWCVNPKAGSNLKNAGVRFPYMFVAIYERVAKPNGEVTFKDVARKAFRLERGIGSIEFHKAGKFVLVANIIGKSSWISRSKAEEAVAELLEKQKGKYSSTMVFGTTYNRPYASLPFTFTCEVGVEAEFFAKKPAEWLWKWVNKWFENPPDNQCKFRRRAMMAFSIQPPIVLVANIFYNVFRLVFGILLLASLFLIGRRGLHIWPLWHPYNSDLVQCQSERSGDAGWKNMERGSYYFNITNKKGIFRSSYTVRLMMTPVLWVVVSGLFLLLSSNSVGQVVSPSPHGFTQVIFVAFVVLAVFYVLGILSSFLNRSDITEEERERRIAQETEKLETARAEHRRQMAEAEQKRRKEELERFYEKHVAPLTCTVDGPTGAHVNDLPASHRGIILRAEEFKQTSGVCKPYQH